MGRNLPTLFRVKKNHLHKFSLSDFTATQRMENFLCATRFGQSLSLLSESWWPLQSLVLVLRASPFR